MINKADANLFPDNPITVEQQLELAVKTQAIAAARIQQKAMKAKKKHDEKKSIEQLKVGEEVGMVRLNKGKVPKNVTAPKKAGNSN